MEKIIGAYLKRKRIEQKKGQKEFSLHVRTVQRIESGSHCSYSIRKLNVYAKELGVANEIQEALKGLL